MSLALDRCRGCCTSNPAQKPRSDPVEQKYNTPIEIWKSYPITKITPGQISANLVLTKQLKFMNLTKFNQNYSCLRLNCIFYQHINFRLFCILQILCTFQFQITPSSELCLLFSVSKDMRWAQSERLKVETPNYFQP